MKHRNPVSMLVILILTLAAGTAFAGLLTVTTDAGVYRQGDIVTITIANPSTETAEVSSSPWYGIFHQGTLDCMYGCVGLPVIESIGAGEIHVFTHDTAMNPDPVGYYEVVVFEIGTGPLEENPVPIAVYELLAPVANETTAWGSVKALY